MEDGFDGFLLSPAQMAGLHVRGRLSWRTAVRRQNGLKGQVRPDPNASARSRGRSAVRSVRRRRTASLRRIRASYVPGRIAPDTD